MIYARADHDPKHCKASVTDPWAIQVRQCSRKPWKDGWCKQHHPDEEKKRYDATCKAYNEKWDRQFQIQNMAGVHAFISWLENKDEHKLVKLLEPLVARWNGGDTK